MQIEIITIGNEILSGRTLDTNFSFLARALEEVSVAVGWHTTVGDTAERIGEALRIAVGRADAVVMTGGLGPTPDDITRKTVSTVLGRPLRLDDRVVEDLRAMAKRRGRKMAPSLEGQALIPVGAEAWPNRLGSAPGILILHENTPIVLLPGVPQEMEALARDSLVPFLRARTGRTIETFTLRTAGVYESLLHEKIGSAPRNWPSASLAYLPGYSGVDLRVTVAGQDPARVREVAQQAHDELMSIVGAVVFAEGGTPMEQVVGDLLVERGWKFAAAESCTGGLLAKRMTDAPGASRYFERGFVTYSNESKIEMLGVDPKVLQKQGAVSQTVAEQMAAGAAERAGVQVGVGITGVAGPDGGTVAKPVGTVFIAVATPDGNVSRKFRLHGTRDVVRQRSTQAAFDMTRRQMLGLPIEPRLD
jgi:competence/damage-inducible protein CinA-like protein